MSGFKDDVISILKTNSMLHGEAIGWIFYDRIKSPKVFELLSDLQKRKLPVVSHFEKEVFRYSYIVLSNEYLTFADLFDALSSLAPQGIIIIEDWLGDLPFKDKYVVPFAKITITKVKFEDRIYMVIHEGVDYGD